MEYIIIILPSFLMIFPIFYETKHSNIFVTRNEKIQNNLN